MEMASFKEEANPVRLLLDIGSGASVCSPDSVLMCRHTLRVRCALAQGQVK